MDIKQRMEIGHLYTDHDDRYPKQKKELAAARECGKELTYDFNLTRPSEVEKRQQLVQQIFGKIGKNVWIEPPLRVAYGSNTTLGDNVYINFNLTLVDDYSITIGNNVMFAPNVTISVTGHPVHKDIRKEGEQFSLPVVIEDDVWIGAGVIILPGVTIGSGSVIGAGSVVTKDIPSNVVAVGNPCRVLREITDYDKEYYRKDMRFDDIEW